MKKILSILLLISLLTIAFTACDITPSVENEESQPQNSTGSSSNNSDDVNDNNNNTNNNSDNDNSTNNGENTPPPSTTLTEEEKYNNALSLLSKGKNQEAYELLNEIKTYAPAQEKLKNFFYAPQTVVEKWKYADDADYHTDSIVYTYNSMGNIVETSDNEIFTYDSNGNVLSGRDLIFGTYYTYTYQNGKLFQEKSSDDTTTYYYNSNGQISKVVIEFNGRSDERVYEYTYYASGNVKTIFDGYSEYSYAENGILTKVVGYGDYIAKTEDYTLTLTYEEYGLSKINLQDRWGGVAVFTYSYDSSGNLTSLEVKSYEEGILDSTHIFTFSNHILCYSENPAVIDRIGIVYYTDIDAALEIIW